MSPRIKHFDDLLPEDFLPDSIWVDAEYGEWFPGCPALPAGLEEDDAVEFPADCYRGQIDLLREVGRFYVKGGLCFSDGSEHFGRVAVRAYDLTPYCVDVFHAGEWLFIAHEARELCRVQERVALCSAFQTSLEKIFPLRVQIQVEGLPAISAVFELTED